MAERVIVVANKAIMKPITMKLKKIALSYKQAVAFMVAYCVFLFIAISTIRDANPGLELNLPTALILGLPMLVVAVLLWKFIKGNVKDE